MSITQLASPRRKKTRQRPRLLVVEDERIVALGIQAQLEGLGYEVVGLAASGPDAIARAEQARPDLVLMDVHLEGEMDGVEAARIIRRRFGAPVVYLTAYSDREVVERAKLTEPFGYALKPFEERELSVVVEMALYRHRMERKLRAQKRLLSATLRSIGDGVIATDRAGRVRFLNPVAERMTGWGQKEARGRALEEVMVLVQEGTGEAIESPLRTAVRERAPGPLVSHAALVSRACSLTPIDDCTTPLTNGAGALLGGVMVFRDVTEHRAALEVVAKLAAIVSSSDDAIVATTAEGVITGWNAAAERLFGHAAGEATGHPLSLIVPPGRLDELGPVLVKIAQGERVPSFETQGLRKDGSQVDVLVTVSPIRGEDGQFLGGAMIARDVTHLRRLEEQYRQAQKLESVGRLAGGIAHNFNNLLTAINGFAYLVRNSLSPEDRNRELLAQVIGAGERAAALTGQLLTYSRKQMFQPQVVNLCELIAGTEEMMRQVVREDVEISVLCAPDLYPIKVDLGQLEQVVMNLVVNARDAMPTGGKLTVQAANVQLDGVRLPDETLERSGPYVRLEIADTGCGMSKATMAHLFEPFFTTKEVGKGTGLGLATAHGIVKQSGGFIEVDSAPGQGARFQIYFPAAHQEDVLSEAAQKCVGDLPGGSETVLVVEDEECVRKLVGHLLRNCGYTVLEAADGEQALELLAHHEGRVDLLLTDVVMPRMSGAQVAEEVKSTHPEARVLFQSGYTEEALGPGMAASEPDFIQKPFAMEQLARKVRAVLDRQRPMPGRTPGASPPVRSCIYQVDGRRLNGAPALVCNLSSGACPLQFEEAAPGGKTARYCSDTQGPYTDWQQALECPAPRPSRPPGA